MFRIGTEHEKIGFDVKTLRPITYEQITALLNGISERFDWDKVMETGTIIGLKQVMYSFFFSTINIMSYQFVEKILVNLRE